MDTQIIIGLLLSLAPITELRLGLPVVVEWALSNGQPIFPWFLLVVVFNCLGVLLAWFFLDFIHWELLRIRAYRRWSKKYLDKVRKKGDYLEAKYGKWIFPAITLFVAIPATGTGAWTGGALTWVLGLDRKYSFIALSIGIFIAGLLMLAFSLSFLGLIK
jgi:uncharacterized membrane protein